MQYNYSLKNYLNIWVKVIISYLSIIVIFNFLTGRESSPIWSYFTLLISCILGLKLFYHLFLRDIDLPGFRIVLSAFLIKMILSTVHFLMFIQPDYFKGDTSYVFIWDYLWMHDSISLLADSAQINGFFNALKFEFFILNKGAIIYYLYSPIYLIGGDLVLNLSHFSAVFTLFTAMLITYMAKYFFDLNKNQLRGTLLLCCFFPFGLIISMTMRDFAGQFLIALGFISLQYSFKNSKLIILFFVAALLLFFQRKNYAVIPFLTYFLLLVFYTKKAGLIRFSLKFNLRIIFLTVIAILGYSIYNIASQVELVNTDVVLHSEYLKDITKIQFYLLLPIYIFKGFLGPFPWTQYLKFIPETIYQLSDYLTSTFLFTMVLTLIRKKVNWNKLKAEINMITIASVLISSAGIASGYMHLGYISISAIFLIPFLMKYMNLRYFLSNFIMVFFVLLLLSLLWYALGFSGEGIWNDFSS